jgi:WD40 repeat protein/Cdc6-like AAA superfamily ATPase
MTATQTLNFSAFIADRTKDFTGREWVFAAIDRWLAAADAPRTFLLTGGPGTGKTAVAARLVQISLDQVASDACPRLGRDALAYFHFCQANSDATLNPLRVVEALARALANRHDAFREALLKTGDRDITINATQSVGTAAGGSQVRNVVINELHIGALSARSAFDRVVRSPLEALVASGFDQALVVLVDSLDEALTFPGEENLVTLLAHTGDLPGQVRFVLTSRPDKRVTDALGERTLDLVEDAPVDVDDVRTYVEARLHAQADPLRLDFARRVTEASQGNFLYARYKLDEAIPRLDKGEAPSAIELPAGLDGIYREFLKRELAADLDAWEDRYRPVLGLLAVARGEGLTGEQIAHITNQKRSLTDDLLRRCGQYLAGPDAQGRVRIYHQSFRDFLLQDADFQVYPDEANAGIADWYWTSCFDQAAGRHTWSSCNEYGLTNLPFHLDAAGRREHLRTLLLDYGWLQAKLDRLGVNALLADFSLGQPVADDATQRLGRALEQGAYVLARDPAQLAPQLLGRLLDDEDGGMQTLLTQAQAQCRRPCLLPRTASLRETGALLRTLAGHTGSVNAVAVTPDGRRAVSASGDNTLKVWEMSASLSASPASGQELRTLKGHTDSVWGVAVTPDGSRAISASRDHTLKVWDLRSGGELSTLTGHTDAVTGVAVTPDGSRAVSASYDHTLKVWDLARGAALLTLTGHTAEVLDVTVTPDGTRAVSASEDNTLKVWDLASGRELHTLKGHTISVWGVAVMPDGRRAVSASADATLKIWDLASGVELRTLAGHKDGAVVTDVAVTPDGSRAISASNDHTLKVWDLASGQELRTLEDHTDSVWGVAVTPDGARAISASNDHTIKVWDISTALNAGMASGQELRTPAGHAFSVWGVAVTPDGSRAVSASVDATLKVWDLASGQELRTLTGHRSGVTAVVVTPDGSHAVSASGDNTLKVWDLASGVELRTLADQTGWVWGVAVTPDGRGVVSALDDTTLKVWDLAGGAKLRTLTGHTNRVTSVAVTPDGRTIVAAGRSGRVHFLRWEESA